MENEFELFFKMNERRVHYQLQRLNVNVSDVRYDELYGEGIVALWKAYQAYNRDRGNMGTYLNFQIRYRLLDLIRKRTREVGSDTSVVEGSKNGLCDGNWARSTGLPIVNRSGVVARHESDAFWQAVREPLSDKQWKWVEYIILAELSVKEVMEIEGVTKEAVKSWGKEARKKLRQKEVCERLRTLSTREGE